MNFLVRVRVTVVYIIAAFFIVSCASLSTGPSKVTLVLSASDDINPDEDQRSSPLVLNILLLSDARQFERENFISLFENPEEILGKDVMKKVRLKELIPGETRAESFDIYPEVKYLGVIAEFSQYQRAKSLMLIPVGTSSEKIYLNIDKLNLSSASEYQHKVTM